MHAYVLVLVHVRARQSFALKACARFGAETQRRYGRRSQGNHSPQDPWRVIHLQGHPNAYRGLRCRGARNVAIGYFGEFALRKSSRSEQCVVLTLCLHLATVDRPSALAEVLERELERLKGSIIKQLLEGLGKFSEVSYPRQSTLETSFDGWLGPVERPTG